jgi:hypothetical protein
MGEKLIIRQGEQAGGVIGHDVDIARHVEEGAVVAMEALVKCLEPEQVSRGGGGCSGTFSLPGHCWGVVGTTRCCALSHIIVVGCDIVLHDSRCKFEVGVRNLPRRIVEGHKVFHNVWLKTRARE